jgi:cytochrome c oxidase subunit 4
MMLLTLSTYAVGKSGYSGVIIVLFLLLTTLIKGSFIIRDFMELKDVSLLWRLIMYGWLWTVCLVIAVTYFISLYKGV